MLTNNVNPSSICATIITAPDGCSNALKKPAVFWRHAEHAIRSLAA